MKLNEAIILLSKHWWKVDILELLWIELRNNILSEPYYKESFSKLPVWDYFVSDLDWTFFRWMLAKETFSYFFKFIKKKDLIRYSDIERIKEFLDDNKYFDELEKKAYNKQIDYIDYMNAWIFLLFKYRDLASWSDFLKYLKDIFTQKQKLNPFRFSIKKMIEVLESWKNFIFISWANHFVLEIYLELLKEFVSELIKKDYSQNIFAIWTYVWIRNSHFVPMFWRVSKDNILKLLKEQKIINHIIWWMWDTSSDYWIANNVDIWWNFYFVNPEESVLNNFESLKREWINYEFIFERKNLIFKMDISKIDLIK